MKPSIAGGVAIVSLVLLASSALAGSGIGKGDPSSAPEAVPMPTESAPQEESSPPENAGAQEQMQAPEPGPSPTPAFDNVSELTASGHLANIDTGAMSFSCHCGSGDWTFATTPDTVFQKSNSLASFVDLAPGGAVTVQYHAAGNGLVADKVVIAP
jgi:hypothetical protein